MVGLGKKYFNNPCRTALLRSAMKTKLDSLTACGGDPMADNRNSVTARLLSIDSGFASAGS